MSHQEAPPTIQEMIDVFLETVGAKSEDTARTYGTGVNHFLAYLDVPPTNPASDLTLQQARRFALWLTHEYRGEDGQPLSRNSRAVYLTAVARFYRTLMDEKVIQIAPLDYDNLRQHFREVAGQQTRYINDKLPDDWMIEALIEAARKPPQVDEDAPASWKQRVNLIWLRNLAIILALHSSGMRVGELCQLRRGDLDYGAHSASVTGKGDKKRRALFSIDAWAALMKYLEARQDGTGALEDKPLFCRHDKGAGDRRLPLSPDTVRDVFTRQAEDAGVAQQFNLTPHSLRHWFATRFLGHTGNLALTQDVLGHADPRTTRIYAKTTDEAIKEAHKDLFDREKSQ